MKISLFLAAVLLTASLVSGCSGPGASGIDGGPTKPFFAKKESGPSTAEKDAH